MNFRETSDGLIEAEIVRRLASIPELNPDKIQRVKIQVCKEMAAERIPRNSDLILHAEGRGDLAAALRRKPVRSASGVTIVAVMPKPWACPHGKCTYCPGGPEVGVPRAYTGREPLAMRAQESQYDPFTQVSTRIRQLNGMGHPVDKVELIIAGGTFPFLPRSYQEDFVKSCLEALNGKRSRTLDEAKSAAETSPQLRNVGITVETRPDWARKGHVDHMLTLGATRVELGVQNVFDDIYLRINRQHTVEDVIEATRTLKDSAFKVGYHMMPGLPGSSPERDLEGFTSIFEKPCFRPDMVKIYPCLVVPGTELYEEWRRGDYQAYDAETVADIISEVKQMVPPWVRIMRIQREIPAADISAGPRNGNLREIVAGKLSKMGARCRCIRCREVGIAILKKEAHPQSASLKVLRYDASEGLEIFESYEDEKTDLLIGYLRLRIPSTKAHRPEIAHTDVAMVRELHVLGETVPVGQVKEKAFQHKRYGASLLAEAERLAKEEYDCRKITVISALGTKAYYMRFGYSRDGPYVSKNLS